MSLYRCTRCDVVENTATGGYWMQQIEAHEKELLFRPLCSQCSTGEWHNEFPREGVSAEWVTDGRGFLWRASELKTVGAHLGPFTPVDALADASCRACDGSGIRDSGGSEPNGRPINVSCECADRLATQEGGR